MKTKILIVVLLALTACKKDDNPAPVKPPPVQETPKTDYYVQVTAVREDAKTIAIPLFAYFTDKEYQLGQKKDANWPATKYPVEVFEDSIDLYLLGWPEVDYAMNIYYQDSLLITDTLNKINRKDIVKWRL